MDLYSQINQLDLINLHIEHKSTGNPKQFARRLKLCVRSTKFIFKKFIMKKLILILLLFSTAICFAQKFELIVGLCPTYSFSGSNIKFDVPPDFLPNIAFEDARDINTFKTKSIDWIQNKNYFGLEPSLEVAYHLGKEITIGLGFFGRQRQIRYDVFLPLLEGISVNSHHFELDFTFIASTLGLKYEHPSHKWNLAFNIGFNYALNKLEDAGKFSSTIHVYEIEEDIVGPEAYHRSFFEFGYSPLVRLTINKKISNQFELGLMIEKQLRNEYGSYIDIKDSISGQTILSGSVLGDELTLGIKMSYKLFSKENNIFE